VKAEGNMQTIVVGGQVGAEGGTRALISFSMKYHFMNEKKLGLRLMKI
jgi:hypothetical protein